MNAKNDIIIKTEGLSKCFNGSIHALKDVNMEIKRVEVVVIIGPSGSGKTTSALRVEGSAVKTPQY